MHRGVQVGMASKKGDEGKNFNPQEIATNACAFARTRGE
jgi:hypothetical protein